MEYTHFCNKELFLAECFKWIDSMEIETLVKMFDGKMPENLELKDKFKWLVGFSEIWDFRNKQKGVYDLKTGEKARWLIDDSFLNSQQVLATMNVAKMLGMVDCVLPAQKLYDYIFVLGGARMSCFFRMKYAKELCSNYGITANEIVGLTGMRPISDSERSATDTYAPKSCTEFDLMCAAVQKLYGKPKVVKEEKQATENNNCSWAVKKYMNHIPIIVLAAPSSEPDKRRANTADTFLFWKQQEQISGAKRILLVTSQIYVPYQQIEAVRILGIPYGYDIETVGFPKEWTENMQGLQTAGKYLQEIRSTLLSMAKLM